jgi:hypothetical protein
VYGTMETISRITVQCLCVAVSGLITDFSVVALISTYFMYSKFIV